MTDLSPREKALVEAAKDVLAGATKIGSWDSLENALRAYDPPKPKVPQIPDWMDFIKGKSTDAVESVVFIDGIGVGLSQYEIIRRATSKEAE